MNALINIYDEQGNVFCHVFVVGVEESFTSDIKNFVKSRTLVCGFHPEDRNLVFHTMYDLASCLVAYLKEKIARSYRNAGGVYLISPQTKVDNLSYIYHIKPYKDRAVVEIEKVW